jgi:hypothetical protein
MLSLLERVRNLTRLPAAGSVAGFRVRGPSPHVSLENSLPNCIVLLPQAVWGRARVTGMKCGYRGPPAGADTERSGSS